MSHNKRHGTAETHLRDISKPSRFDTDRTMVDIKPRRDGSIPSITKGPKQSTPAPNVIPFTKPRAIAAIAAAHPEAVVIKEPTKAQQQAIDQMFAAPMRNVNPAPTAPATRVATGWTPPGAVPNVKPAAPVAQVSQTLYPMPAPAHVPAAVSAPAPVIPVPPLHIAVAPTVQAIAQPAVMFSTPAASAPAVMYPAPAAAPTYARAQTPAPAPLPAPPPSTTAAPASRWAAFEKLGLGMPKVNSQKAAKLVVSAYRLLGFVILTIIVVVLVGYLVSSAFFYMSSSWVVPMAVSRTDEKVVALQAQLAEQQNTRDRIADDLAQSERTIAAQEQFQAEFAKAIKNDLAGRKSALSRVRALADAAAATRASIRAQSSAYASASRKRMADEYAAGLIDRNTMLSGKFQIAQITSSNLSLAERQAEFETRAQELEDQTRSLDAVLANEAQNETALSYEVLRIKQEYEASKLDLAKSVQARDTLKQGLARQDKIVKSLEQSSYLRAINDGASVAFVPYGNLSNVEKGTSVYACRVGMIICRNVGEVLEILPGEVQFKHPQRDKQLRGQMVELKLDEDDGAAAADDVLFVGGRPLLF